MKNGIDASSLVHARLYDVAVGSLVNVYPANVENFMGIVYGNGDGRGIARLNPVSRHVPVSFHPFPRQEEDTFDQDQGPLCVVLASGERISVRIQPASVRRSVAGPRDRRAGTLILRDRGLVLCCGQSDVPEHRSAVMELDVKTWQTDRRGQTPMDIMFPDWQLFVDEMPVFGSMGL